VADENGPGSKVKATAQLISDLAPERVVVLCAYKATVRALAKLVGEDATIYTGDENDEQRQAALANFIGGWNPVLIGTLAALGEGVDGLQIARHLVLVDRDWTPARNDQAVGRLRRSGQAGDVVVYHIVVNGSTDQQVALALRDKRDVTEAILS